MNPDEIYHIPDFLKRQRKLNPIDWSVRFMVVLGVLFFGSGLLFFALPAFAAPEGYAGIIKDGEILTADEFCNGV